MDTVSLVLTILGALFSLVYFYQIVFIFIGLIFKSKKYPDAKENHTFAVIISARNEEKVIGNLIKSIQNSDYPQDKLKIFVCADNCTDNTAQICRDLGCTVYERQNKEQVGKGYALNFLFKNIAHDFKDYHPDAFFVFDADNILTKSFIKEMNKSLDSGVDVCVGYRNSKNFGTNWISAGASLGMIRTCRFIHKPKNILNINTAVTGTGFYISKNVVTFQSGWKWQTIVEDTEFSIENTLKKVKIRYNEDAEFYDEQPTTLKQTWKQRLRWVKGGMLTFSSFHASLISAFMKSFKFELYESYFRLFPISIWYGFTFVASAIIGSVSNIFVAIHANAVVTIMTWLSPILISLLTTYLGLLIDSFITVICEWKRIKAPASRKILSIFTSPIFSMIFDISTAYVALFKKVKWDPIEHSKNVTQEQLEQMQ